MTVARSQCNLRFGAGDFDLERLGSSRCPVKGCAEPLQNVRFRKGEKPWCPAHGIRLHAGTFAYWNGPDLNDQARLRNFIVREDLVAAIALPKGMKAESHRLGFEMSEDAVTWNVFVSFAAAGKLTMLTKMLTGDEPTKEPTLYLWGRKIDLHLGEFGEYPPLLEVRKRLEPDIHTFVTEPDIMLVADGELLVCVEAKFGSANPLAYEGAVGPGQKPTARTDLLKRYLDHSLAPRAKAAVVEERIPLSPRSQLLRNVVFAAEMANGIPWRVVNLVSSTQALSQESNGREEKRKSYLDPTEEVLGYLRGDLKNCFTYRTWEAIYKQLVRDDEELVALNRYMKDKSAHFKPAFGLVD